MKDNVFHNFTRYRGKRDRLIIVRLTSVTFLVYGYNGRFEPGLRNRALKERLCEQKL